MKSSFAFDTQMVGLNGRRRKQITGKKEVRKWIESCCFDAIKKMGKNGCGGKIMCELNQILSAAAFTPFRNNLEPNGKNHYFIRDNFQKRRAMPDSLTSLSNSNILPKTEKKHKAENFCADDSKNGNQN